MKKKNVSPIKWMLGGIALLSIILYGTHHPLKINLIPSASVNTSQTQGTSTNNQTNASTMNINTLNPLRTNAEVLQAIAEQNENREKIAALLAAHAQLAAQIRQQVSANKYQTVTAQSIPGPSTTPAPADLLAKLKSNQLMHH